MITLTGISRFRVLREVEGFTPYIRCEVAWDGFDARPGPGRDATPASTATGS